MDAPEVCSIICKLLPDRDDVSPEERAPIAQRRELAKALLQRRPYVVDDKATREEFEKARAILLGMRDLDAWTALLGASRVWAALLDVRSPIAASMLHTAARRAAGDPKRFRDELAEMKLTPTRRGPKGARLANYLADNVVRAYRCLTDEPPPRGDPYNNARPVAESLFYQLGEAAFREHRQPWHASRLLNAAKRATDG